MTDMTENYFSRLITSTKTLMSELEAMEFHHEQHGSDYQEDITEIKEIIAERTLMALITGGKTEDTK